MAQSARTAQSPNFGSILDRQSSEVERPKPIPAGTYLAVVKGLPRFDKSAKKQTEFVEFTLALLQAGEDVDEDDLATALTKKSGEKVKLTDKTMRDTYYLTEDALWRLKKFLEDCGIDDDSASLRQLINETPNCQVWVTVKHTASEDGEAVYANIAGTAKVED